jgi:hypothetical protein
MPRVRLAPWIRRAIEAAVAAALVAIGTLAGEQMSAGGTIFPIPAGLTGALVLAPPVLALGVITIAYPVAMAATRSDALMGAVAAYLVAADVTTIVAASPVSLERANQQLGGGLFVTLLALGPAVIGLVAGQLATSLGFGRRAGAAGAIVAGVASVIVLVAISMVA